MSDFERTGPFSLPIRYNDEPGFTAIAEEADTYAKMGKLGSEVEVRGRTAHFANSAERAFDILPNALKRETLTGNEEEGYGGNSLTDEHGLPLPEPFAGPCFDIFDYCSPKYAWAKETWKAVASRGIETYADHLVPEDFEDLPEGFQRLGIASLWSQSTWDSELSNRNLALERAANSVRTGDLLVVSPFPAGTRLGGRSGTWGEIRDLGFGFYTLRHSLLPFCPYYDFDQDLFFEALLTLERGQAIVCAVRSRTCNGGEEKEDEIAYAPSFNWRVYSCEVTVLRVNVSHLAGLSADNLPQKPA